MKSWRKEKSSILSRKKHSSVSACLENRLCKRDRFKNRSTAMHKHSSWSIFETNNKFISPIFERRVITRSIIDCRYRHISKGHQNSVCFNFFVCRFLVNFLLFPGMSLTQVLGPSHSINPKQRFCYYFQSLSYWLPLQIKACMPTRFPRFMISSYF